MSRGRDVSLSIFITYLSGSKRFLLTASSALGDYQAWGWHFRWPKGMKDFASFNATKVKRAAAEEKERDEYSSAQRQ